MAMNIKVRVVPFGEVVFQNADPVQTEQTTATVQVQQPIHYAAPTETAPKIIERRDERETISYIVPVVTR